MFRCQKCKKWLKNITTETDVVYDGTIYHATNVPAKICPECGCILRLDSATFSEIQST